MPLTEYDDLLVPQSSVTAALSLPYAVIGTPIAASEIADRLSEKLYEQLSGGVDSVVVSAAERATVHIGVLTARVGKRLDLDDTVMREIVVLMTIYELHMALGNESAGREYRLKAKDLIVATFGNFPEGDKPTEASPPVAAIKLGRRRAIP
jgi:hypothetical protein